MSKFIRHGPCPACNSSDAFSLYDDGHGYCFSCQRYFRDPMKAPEDYEQRSAESQNFLFGEVRALTKRGITADTARKYSYRVSKVGATPVQIANYYDSNKVLVAQHLRYPDKTFTWIGDINKVLLFGQHLWNSGGQRLIITEGEIDCLTISQAFKNSWPVVSVPNGASSAAKFVKRSLEFVSSFGTVVLAFDDDEPGRKAVEEVAALLPPGKVRVMSYDGFKDANELALNAGFSRIPGRVFEAKPYRPDGIISGMELWEEVLSPPQGGIDLIYPVLSEKLMGFVPGELVMVTAGSGIGKSTFVHEIGFDFLMKDQVLGVLALEESPRRAAERYLSIYLNRPLHLSRQGVTEEQLREAFDKTVGSGRFWIYRHFGSTQIDNLLAKIRYMVVGLGVRWILLDHISIVVSGLDEGIAESERRLLDKLMTRLRALVEETGCGVVSVVHLKRPEQGKSYNEGRQISLTDLRGSAALEQLSDTVIALERNQQAEEDADVSRVRILKSRRTGNVGLADTLIYNRETGRLLPLDYSFAFGGNANET